MATEEQVKERFEILKTAVNEWADRTKKRLQDEVDFLKSLKGSTKKLTDQSSTKESTLAFTDLTDFLKS